MEIRTYEDRLEEFAQKGRTSGFRISLWKNQAKKLEKEGIILRNPRPTEQSGKISYDIDFSLPIPGTFSEHLHKIALENVPEGKKDEEPAEPLHPPYELP